MRFNSFSIRIKLILILSITSAIALFISSLTFSTYIYNTQKTNYINSLNQLASISSENIKPAIIFIDEVGAKNIISSFKTNENILSVMLYSGDTLFASYFSDLLNKADIEEFNSKSKEQIEKFNNILKNDKKSVDISDGDKIYLLSPIILDNELIGVFYIISNTTMLKNYLINLTLIQILITVITLFFIIYLSTKIHKIFTKPIFELVDVMKYISETKRFDIRIDLNQLDEFKNLNDGFNGMITEINSRDDNLNSLIKKLEIAKRETDEIHSQLRDSINYASLIQHAIMPIEHSFSKCFKDYFILWEPRDTVGGDIYLFEELPNDKGFLAMVIDCTGHGVAGAFVTMLVKAIEREIVSQIINQTNEISPAEILSLFNKSIKTLLRQDDINSISNAGFDGGVLYINKNENYVKFSGAETSLFYIQNGVVETIKGCRHSIGYKKSDVNFEFKEHKIETTNETYIYITTDGFLDQIGGDKGFPFGKNRFKDILKNSFDKKFTTQKAILIDSLNSYRGKNDKTDDVTILGFKI